DARWNAIPVSVRPYAWLDLSMPREFDYEKFLEGDVREALPTPVRRVDFEAERSLFYQALERAQKKNIPLLLQMNTGRFLEKYGLNTGTADEMAEYSDLFKHFPCIAGIHTAETASFLPISANVSSHIKNFTALARKYNRKFVWTAFMAKRICLWNNLMTDSTWVSFMKENSNTIIPIWKNVEPHDNMLNWADCVGLWLSGHSGGWGIKFDSWYYSNLLAVKSGARREQYYPSLGKNVMNMTLYACPPYLLKDGMILSALTGSSYFSTEAMGAYDYATDGPLRSVLDKTYQFIVANQLWRSKNEVLALCKVALESPVQSEVLAKGFSHSFTKQSNSPNIVWNQVFGIADNGLDFIPNEGKNFIVPVVPKQDNAKKLFPLILKPEKITTGNALSAALASNYPRRFVASDANVLVFDAGKYVYITDSRETNRTDLEFSLESSSSDDYNFLYLMPDATCLTNIKPTKELSSQAWKVKILLPVGCSILMIKK
ncbi:MAG: glycoside hydrolase family 98 domain-containing protein, partial [Paludibacter sp.]